MGELIVVTNQVSARLRAVLDFALQGVPHARVPVQEALPRIRGERVLFALRLSEHGLDAEICALIAALRQHPNAMEGAVGAMLIDASTSRHRLRRRSQVRQKRTLLMRRQTTCHRPNRSTRSKSGSRG